MNIVIEIAKPKDVEKILNIYKPYILNTAITFEPILPYQKIQPHENFLLF